MTIPSPLVTLAQDLAQISGAIIRNYYRRQLDIDDKADASPVTQADREAEQAMRALILERRPEDGIIGEEWGREREDAEWVWVLDPVDGTKAFITGRPLFVTLIGLLHYGKPVLGVIHQPIAGDLWLGIVGTGCTCNGRPVQPTAIQTLAQARLGTTGPDYYQADTLPLFNQLAAQCRFTVYGGDGYQFGLLAQGGMDLVVEDGLKLHDFAAVAPVVISAGGCMTDWQGQALDIHSGGQVIASATAELHQLALPYFAKA